MTLLTPVARYLDGTAFIVYGPGPTTSHNDHHHSSQSHVHSHLHSHSHSHDATDQDQPARFWAVFRPASTTAIHPTSPSAATQQPQEQQHHDESMFFLQGTPYPWGTYPSDMEEPHGCMPPNLYYRVTISEYTSNNNINSSNEWTLPFVHRIGDGNDEAGGLTTIYTLLRDQEDAEDHGDFIKARIHQLQSSSAGDASSDIKVTPSLYACTEILISERRTLDVIQKQFFSTAIIANERNDGRIPGLEAFQHHLLKTLQTVDTTSESLPFSLVQSDLKLILPLHTSSSPSLPSLSLST